MGARVSWELQAVRLQREDGHSRGRSCDIEAAIRQEAQSDIQMDDQMDGWGARIVMLRY